MNLRSDWFGTLQALAPNATVEDRHDWLEARMPPKAIRDTAVALVEKFGCEFATLIVEQSGAGRFVLYYFFHDPQCAALIRIRATLPAGAMPPAISGQVHAADWHEREAEDMFGIQFEGHPFLGDFVLHDTIGPEGVEPMRRQFDAHTRVMGLGKGNDWQPRRLLDQEGAINFPVGPIWADYNEAGLWLLETPGEQIYEGHTRLFYKYRAVEKIAEGQTPDQAVLLAEHFSGSSAFAHAWAFCQALEKIGCCEVPPRARILRVVFAELERIRYHAATIAELAGSTSLVVGKSMSQEVEETLLRLTGQLCGHRYLFGLCVPGGLAQDPGSEAFSSFLEGLAAATREFAKLERLFVHTSSYLDRVEEMGTLRPEVADLYGVVGPVARGSGRALDLRRSLPYGQYVEHPPKVPREIEGDGYARLRVYFAEIRASTELIQTLLADVSDGPVSVDCPVAPGATLAWVEAPAGSTFHWLRIDADGRIRRWHIGPPAFRNWHAFHRALEGAAFQDFHIIMAGFGLSVAESDR